MKKLLVAATALMTGFSLMADISPYAAEVRDALQGLLNARLEHLSTNMNFRAWNRLNQINKNFNQKILNNDAFDKTVSTFFNKQVIETITPLDPTDEADAALFAQGYRYTATVDFSNFGYTFTENADKTGFDVEESASGALEVYYTARSEEDLPPEGGEEPPAGMEPPPGQGEPPTTVQQCITLVADGNSFELLVPARNNPALAVIVRFPQTFVFTVAESADGGEWEPVLVSGITNVVNKADPEAPYVNLVGDTWAVNGLFSMIPPEDSPDPTLSLSFSLGQNPDTNLAAVQFGILKDYEPAATLSVVVTNMSEEVKTFDFQRLNSLADFATMALDECSVSSLSFQLSDRVALSMSVDNCAETVRIQQNARRLRSRGEDTQENMQAVADELNEHVKCRVEITLPVLGVLPVDLELRAVKFGTDYVIVPAFQFDPASGDDGWVALTDMVTQEAVAYAINIADHAVEPARGTLVAGIQVMKYLSKIVTQRIDVEDIVPDTMAEAVADHLKQLLWASAQNATFSSWERINSMNQFFNTHVLNNQAFDKALLAVFNQKIKETIMPAQGEIAAKGYKYFATLDLSDLPYTLTATEAFDGFEVTPSESGSFEMVTPYAPSEKASGFVRFTMTGSGDSNYLIGPSLSAKDDLAIVLVVPDTLELAISTAMNGKDWETGIKGKLHTQFVKANPDELFVNLVHDGWNITGELTTDFAENPRYAADATSLSFDIGQDPVNDIAGVRLEYSHNGRQIVALTAKTTATGEIMDMSSLSSLSSLQDVVGLIASTRAAREISLTLFETIDLDVKAKEAAKLLEVVREIVAARRRNADFATIDALTQQLNELVTAKVVLKAVGLEMPVVFVTVPFGVTFNAVPAIVFPDSETPVPVFSLFDDDARAYLMNILDQTAEPALGSLTSVKQVMVAGQSIVREYLTTTSIGDVEKAVYGEWNFNMSVALFGELLDSEDDTVAGVIQLKFGKPTKKGTVKVSGNVTLLDGKKYTIKPAFVTLPESGPLKISALEVNKLGTLSVTAGSDGFIGAIGDAYTVNDAEVGGDWMEKDSTVAVDFTTGVALPDGMTAESTALLPTSEPVILKKGKWAFNKAATVKVVNGVVTADTGNGKTNLSAMKLTYKPKTGTFKGSFKIYTLNNGRLKKVTVKVSGVVVDGVGFGMTTVNKVPTGWDVTVE